MAGIIIASKILTIQKCTKNTRRTKILINVSIIILFLHGKIFLSWKDVPFLFSSNETEIKL